MPTLVRHWKIIGIPSLSNRWNVIGAPMMAQRRQWLEFRAIVIPMLPS